MGWDPRKEVNKVIPSGGGLPLPNFGGGGLPLPNFGGGGSGGLPPNITGMGAGGGFTDILGFGKLGEYIDSRNPYVSAGRDRKELANKILAETGSRPKDPTYSSAADKSGKLGKNFTTNAGPAVKSTAVKAGSVAAGKVKAGTVAADKVRAGQATMERINAGQLDPAALAADPRALDAMRERALGTGDSPWLKMSLDKQRLEEMTARDAAARQAMSGASAARSQLAMRGGLGSGASTRIAMQSARDMNAARQGIGRAGQLDRLGLGIADDQTKMGLLGATAGLDLQHAGQMQDMSKFNIGTKLTADTTNAQNVLDLSKFNTGLAYDASKTNAANRLDASKFNTGLAYDASKTNVANALDAGKFNTGLAYDASKTNAANTLDASKFNSSQVYDANKTNAANALATRAGENTFTMDQYKTRMAEYGAGKQAAAVAGGGGKK